MLLHAEKMLLIPAAFIFLAGCVNSPSSSSEQNADVFPEVWSMNGFDGKGYEYKVNCGGNYDKLEECFLFDLTRVVVTTPNGTRFELEKDFNINSYSGEVTRRWVLYGNPGGGLPLNGEYSFNYFKKGELVLEQKVDYKPEVIDFPRDVKWSFDGDDIIVSWSPPDGMKTGMWYKVLLFPENGQVISRVFEWDANTARMNDLPLKKGDKATLNVAAYFKGGYSYSEYFPITFTN